MFSRLTRLIRALFGVSTAAISPLKILTGIIISVIIPYLLWSFLGGFGIAILLVLAAYLVKRAKSSR